jgi:hypothetical protein
VLGRAGLLVAAGTAIGAVAAIAAALEPWDAKTLTVTCPPAEP